MDPIQVYKLVTRAGRTIIIERWDEECECAECVRSQEENGMSAHDIYSRFEGKILDPENEYGYAEPLETDHETLKEAIEDIRSDYDIVQEFSNTTRAGWEQYFGNDIRWPNWTPTEGAQNV